MTQEQPKSTIEAPRKTRGARAAAAAIASVVLLAAGLMAVAAWKAQPSPRVVPTRVLVDGGRDRKQLTVMVEADYEEPASWHGVGIEGGTCTIATPCAGVSCPVLRASVLRPRQLGAGRVAFEAVVTELWPSRVRQAIQADGTVECTFAAYVDILKTGWRVERELHWKMANPGEEMTASVTPQAATPRLQNGTLVVNASYLFEAELAPGSAVAEVLRHVPVSLRAEFGYVEQQDGALQGGFLVDADLNVTSAANGGKTLLSLPFATTSSASLATLAKYMVMRKSAPTTSGATGEVTGSLEHSLVFAAAPHTPATASLLGDSHQVAWSRDFSFTERRDSGRRLDESSPVASLLSLLPQDVNLVHRVRVGSATVLEVLIAISGGDPAELTLRVRSGTKFTGETYSDVFSLGIRTDRLLEPAVVVGAGGGKELTTDLGNFSTSKSGSTETLTWKADGMSATVSRTGTDFSMNALLPDSITATLEKKGEDFSANAQLPDNITGAFELKSGDVKGSVVQNKNVTLGSVTGTLKAIAAGSEDQRLDLTIAMGEESMIVAADIKMAQSFGGSVVGSVAYPNGTKIASADTKLVVAASGDTDAHLTVTEGAKTVPMIDAKLSLDATEPACGKVLLTLDTEGTRQLGVDVGCTRAAASDNFEAHALVSFNASEPPMVNASVDFVSASPGFGGTLKAHLEAGGEPLVKGNVVAAEGATLRTVDVGFNVGKDPTNKVSVQFSKPGVVDVTVEGSLVINGTTMGKATITGKAIDHVINTQVVGTRRELMVANAGAWNAAVSTLDNGALADLFTVSASLAQVGSVATFELKVPKTLVATVASDSSSSNAVAMTAKLSVYETPNGTETVVPVANITGVMTQAADTSTGTMTLAAGDFKQAMDMKMSRWFVAQPDSTYKMSMSASANISEMGMIVEFDDAYVATYQDWSMAGVGWDLTFKDINGSAQLMQGVDLGMAAPPPPPDAKKVVGKLKVAVTGDVAAFVADPAVKKGFKKAIANKVGVPMSSVKVTLSVAARRLSDARRLSGSVNVDYEIIVPEGTEVTTVASTLTSLPPAELTTAVVAAVAEESGGSSPYALTVTESSAPVVEDVTPVAGGETDGAKSAVLPALLTVLLAAGTTGASVM